MEKSNKKPVLVVIDIQKEYNTSGRAFFIQNIGSALTQAKRVLSFARENNWSIIHVRHMQDGSIFNINESYSEFIEGFEPKNNEVQVQKGNFSCFSSEEFADYLFSKKESEIVVIGFNSTMCVPSTIIDGYHRGFNMTLVRDASAAKKTARFDELSTHEYMVDVLGSFSKIKTTDEVLQ